MKTENETTAAPGTLRITSIERSPTNPRKAFDPAKIAHLAETIRAQGILQKLLVRPWPGREGMFELVDGERRWRAAQSIGLTEVPVTVRELSDAAVIEIQLISGETSEPLTAIEEAEGFRFALALRDDGEPVYTVDKLAEKTGRSAKHVRSILQLLRLPGDVQRAVDAGRLPMRTAVRIAMIPVDELRVKAAQDIMPNELRDVPLTSEQAESLIHEKYTVSLIAAPFDVADATLDGPNGHAQPCTGCEHRVIGEGSRKNKPMCLHPECYRAKCALAWERAAAKAKAAGQRVLTDEEAAEVFEKNSPVVQIAFSSPYVDVDSKPTYRHVANEVEDKSLPTWRELLETAAEKKKIKVPTVLARDRTGKQWELVQLTLAIEAARAIGEDYFKKTPVNESMNSTARFERDAVRSTVRATDDFAAKKKAEADAAKKRMVESCLGIVALHEALTLKALGYEPITDALLHTALHHAGNDGQALFAKAFELKTGGGDFEFSDAIEQWFKARSKSARHAAIPVLLVVQSMKWSGLKCEGFAALAEAVKLDVAAIEQAAAVQLGGKKDKARAAKKRDVGAAAVAAVRGSVKPAKKGGKKK